MEIIDGNGTDTIRLQNIPVVKVRKVVNDTTHINPNNVYVNKNSGILRLSANAEKTDWANTYPHQVKIQYDYARMERDTVAPIVETTDLVRSGITVLSGAFNGAYYNSGIYVRIYGIDGKEEVAKITTYSSGASITADTISVTHISGSYVEKLQVPKIVERYISVCCGIGFIANVVGSTFDDITGYDLAELNVQKGEGYAQWGKAIDELTREYNQLKKIIRPMASVW